MYEEFFEMANTPFTRGIPVEMLYRDRDTEEVYNRLVYAAKKQLFAILVGDAGAGKTTLLRRLKEDLEGTESVVLYLADSKLTPRHFYNGLLEQLGCETKFYRGDSRKTLHKQIDIMRGVENRRLVVIVDEGHLLDKDMLEEIRFLLNYRMDSDEAVYPKTEIQNCIIHQIRNSTKYVSYKDLKALVTDLKAVYAAVNEEAALNALETFSEHWDRKYPKISASWRENWPNLSTYFKYPAELRRLIYTTNAIEGFNRQLRKVTKAKSVFPTNWRLHKIWDSPDFYYEEFPVSVDWEAMDNAYPEVIGWVYFPALKISAPLVVSDTCTESNTFVTYTEYEADFVEENNVFYFNGGSFSFFAKKKYISNDSTAFVALKSGYDFELCPCIGTSKSSASGAKVTETTWSNLTEKGEWLNSLLERSDFENVYTWATEDALTSHWFLWKTGNRNILWSVLFRCSEAVQSRKQEIINPAPPKVVNMLSWNLSIRWKRKLQKRPNDRSFLQFFIDLI